MAFGAPFDEVAERFTRSIRQLERISERVYILADRMPETISHTDSTIITEVGASSGYVRFRGWPLLGVPMKAAFYLRIQLRMALWLLRMSGNLDIVCFATGVPYVLPLMLSARALGKRVVVQVGGTAYFARTAARSRPVLADRFIGLMEGLCYHLASTVGAENAFSSRFLRLDRFGRKVEYFGAFTYVNLEQFHVSQKPSGRENVVGYVGRLARGKGVLDFARAAKLCASIGYEIRFKIVGSGPLQREILRLTEKEIAAGQVECTGYMPNAKIADLLGQMRLLVHPSHSEGLPHVVLEAMACGTPVLTTLVGGLPELVRDGVTGFVLEDSSPESIASGIKRALNASNLDDIASAARVLVERNYSFEAIVAQHSRVLSTLVRV